MGFLKWLKDWASGIGANRTVVALSLARMGDAIGNSILFIVIPLYVAQLPASIFSGLSEPLRVGLLVSAFGLVNAGLQPFTGALVDRTGRHKLWIEAGLVIAGLATLSFVFAGRYWDMLLLRAAQGAGLAVTIPATVSLLAVASQKKTRGGSMGVFTMLRMVGLAIGPVLGGFLKVQYGFDANFIAGSSMVLIGAVLVQFLVDDKRMPVKPARERGDSRFIDLGAIGPGILAASLATFAMATAFSLMLTLEQQFNARLNLTALGFSVAFSAFIGARLVTQLPLGRLSDHIGRRPVILGGLLLMAPATALLGLSATMLEFTGLRVVQGIASAGIAAPAFAAAADLAKEGSQGRQMSVLTIGFGLGVAAGPLISGLLVGYFFELPFLVGTALLLLAAWIVFRGLPETVERDQQRSRERAAEGSPADGE